MKLKTILLSITFAAGLLSFKPADEVYKVDVTKSKIEWIGKKVAGEHKGMVNISGGTLTTSGKALKGGKFDIDMNSIIVTDLKGESNGKLLGHLKSDDFFSVAKSPISKFEITKVTASGADNVVITGNLTIKGITNEVTFPASVKQQKGVIVAVANGVKVNRTKFDIKYGSKSFFEGIADKAIDDDFELNINLVAKK